MNRNISEGTVERVVNGGFGLIRTDEGIVFLKYTAPGEKVKYRISEKAKGILWGKVIEIIKPHPDRVQPRCEYYGECGGCALSHLNYNRQVKIKESILADDLERIGKIGLTLDDIHRSPEFFYRV